MSDDTSLLTVHIAHPNVSITTGTTANPLTCAQTTRWRSVRGMTGAPGTTLRDDVAAAAGSRTLWGAFVSSDSPHVAEIMGRSGFDWLVVDTQHAPVSGSGNLALMISAAGIAGSRVLVRIPWKTDFAAAMWALDAGADGVLAPMIDSAEEAAAIAGACRYPQLVSGASARGAYPSSTRRTTPRSEIAGRCAWCRSRRAVD